jgi:tetratricopeptide (TPR) repeat protein
VLLVRRFAPAHLVPLLLLTAQDAYDRGAALLRNGQIDAAIAAFEQVLQHTPRSAPALRGLGVAHASRGEFKLAEQPLRGACEIDPRDPDGCYYYGLASYNLGRYENAAGAYRQALKSSGRPARAHTGLGLAYEALGRAGDAERELREAVATDDGKSLPDFDPRVELGAFLLRQGRLDEAKATLLDARQDSPRAHFELGRILTQEGKLDEAAARLAKAVALDPSYAAARLLLGRVYFRLGRAADGERETALGRKLSAPKP